jgi:hypothetical protein
MRAASAILLILLLGVSIYAIRHKFIDDAHKNIGLEKIKPVEPGKGRVPTGNTGINSTLQESLQYNQQDLKMVRFQTGINHQHCQQQVSHQITVP